MANHSSQYLGEPQSTLVKGARRPGRTVPHLDISGNGKCIFEMAGSGTDDIYHLQSHHQSFAGNFCNPQVPRHYGVCLQGPIHL